MLLAAIVLGLVQSPPSLWTGLGHAPHELRRMDWGVLLISVAISTAAIILSMRARRLVLFAVAGAVAFVVIRVMDITSPGSSRDWQSTVRVLNFFGWPVAISLASAMIPIVWLRLWGFQLRRVPDAPRAASPA
jgi:NADH:ubiquinone oxidoreductase subunit 6 (subunit J)